MGRFIVVVVLLLAIAFLVYKFLLKGGDPRPADAAPAAAAVERTRLPADPGAAAESTEDNAASFSQ